MENTPEIQLTCTRLWNRYKHWGLPPYKLGACTKTHPFVFRSTRQTDCLDPQQSNTWASGSPGSICLDSFDSTAGRSRRTSVYTIRTYSSIPSKAYPHSHPKRSTHVRSRFSPVGPLYLSVCFYYRSTLASRTFQSTWASPNSRHFACARRQSPIPATISAAAAENSLSRISPGDSFSTCHCCVALVVLLFLLLQYVVFLAGRPRLR